ncbi:TPA: WecB/TagA/CpsF family glycosyltransferase, partial [Escherichia coli]|nr:WecB/TagA/CpsF family glycosyltransferase [Escherichia coli]HEE9719150.1 WecB/TagA/CpsF family glycosyltransferase [Escherichia coli]
MKSQEFFVETLKNSQLNKTRISFLNPYSYPLISRNKKIIKGFDYWFADGLTLCIVTNLFREKSDIIKRGSFDFSSLAGICFDYLQTHSLSVAIIGGSNDEIHQACEYFSIRYPSLKICFKHHGYIDIDKCDHIINELKKSEVQALIVGMGTPKQEEFILKVEKHIISCKLFLTCGGFISQTASSGDYYHPLIKRLGLRWLQRAVLHKHVRRRLLLNYPC